MEFNTPEALYQHYKNVRQRIETASREAAIKNGVIILPIKKLPPPEQKKAAEIEQSEDNAVIEMEPPKHLNDTQRIMYEIALKHGILVSDMRGPVRQRHFVLARQEAMWEIKRQRPDLSLPQLGRMFGGRDHSTIFHGIRAHQQRLDSGKELCV